MRWWGFGLYVFTGMAAGFFLTWMALELTHLWAKTVPLSFTERELYHGHWYLVTITEPVIWLTFVIGTGMGMVLGALAAVYVVIAPNPPSPPDR